MVYLFTSRIAGAMERGKRERDYSSWRFELDLSWKNGKVSRLVVKSRNGGNCRLRSLNPLAGKGLRKAKERIRINCMPYPKSYSRL